MQTAAAALPETLTAAPWQCRDPREPNFLSREEIRFLAQFGDAAAVARTLTKKNQPITAQSVRDWVKTDTGSSFLESEIVGEFAQIFLQRRLRAEMARAFRAASARVAMVGHSEILPHPVLGWQPSAMATD